MAKMQLQQIKTFWVDAFDNKNDLDKYVNEYVIERYNLTGNYPKIKTNSRYISIISNVLVDITRDK